jgi:ATP synthase F1 complex assembly factor 2
MAGRRRFFKTVDILPISPPWESMKDSTDVALLDNPISAGVDGSNSATNISLEKPTVGTMKKYLSPTLSSSSLSPSMAQWYGVTLDGRLLKTPMGTTLSVPSLPLALAVASEWDDQGTYIKPAQMPLMTLVCTTLDQLTIPAVRERTVEDLLRYLRNDTTCYWADAIEDRVLHRKQQKHWEDLHNWIDCEIRGLGMKPARAMGAGEGLVMSRMRASKQFAGLPHSEEMIDNAKMFLNGCDSWKLAAMQTVTMEAKSFLVGMAVVRGVEGWVDSINRLVDGEARPKGKPNPFFHDTKKAVLASRVEEEFQIDNWGLVEGGHDYDRLNCSIQIHAATSLIQSIAFPYATYSSSY